MALASHRKSHRAIAGCASCLAVTFASQAFAQGATPAGATATADAPTGLEEIVVTAQKRAENLQRVPIAITALAPEAIQNSGLRSVQDLPVALPGVQILNISNSYTPRVRGVGSTFTAAGLESPVATFVDDVYHAFAADIQLDFADVDQIAILKGPQGTLFGRNATGGVLQVTTRKPSFDFKGSFETSFDNYLTSRSNAFVTGGLSKDIAASLSVSYAHQGNGYGKNLVTGNDQYKLNHDFSVRGKIHIDVTDRTKADLTADYSDNKGNMAAGYHIFPGRTEISTAPVVTRPWDGARNIDSLQHFRGGGISLKAAQDFDFATLTSISAYRDGKMHYDFSPVVSSNLERNIHVDFPSKQFTEELQLVSNTSGPLSWTIGGFYFYNKVRVGFTNDIGNTLLLPPNAPFKFQSFPSNQITKSIAGYAQATYKITDTTRLTAGIRYTHDVRHFSGQFIATNAFTGVTSVLADVASLPALKGGNNSFQKPTWRLALDHDFGPGLLGYISYNRGIKSGGFNTTGVTNPPFQPEQLDAYEAGFKSQFLDNRVRLNVSGFYYDYKNIQVNIFSTGAPTILNAASARNYGMDADLLAKVTDQLTLTASVDWLHARFTSFPGAPSAVPITSGTQAGGTRGILIDASGNTLPYSPNVTYSIGASYAIPTDFGDITLNGNDNYNSGFFGESDNVLRQKSYHILNASVAWKSPDGLYTARLFVNNILNKAVVSQMVTAPWGYQGDYSNPPRIVGGSLKVNF